MIGHLALTAEAAAVVVGTSNTGIALISAASAIVGAAVGGGVTGWVSLKAEDKRQAFAGALEQKRSDRQDARDQAVIRGACRIWRTRFQQAVAFYEPSVDGGLWMAYELDPPPSAEDRKLVASALTADEWTAIDGAETGLILLIRRQGDRQRDSPQSLSVRFEGDDRQYMAGITALIKGAIVALARTAEASPKPWYEAPKQVQSRPESGEQVVEP
jgi:hypothetical protein